MPIITPTRRSLVALIAAASALGSAFPAFAQGRTEQKPPTGREGKGGERVPPGRPAEPKPAITAEDGEAAAIPGMPDVRFFGDLAAPFVAAVGEARGPWLALSGGGSDGAFGAGLLVGWSDGGRRPVFSGVSGVSAGALMAPYVFLGSEYDKGLREMYLGLSSADVFEIAPTRDSLFDTWPLRKLIESQATPEILRAVAAEHAKGRRLFAVTTNLDAGRPVVWNLGALASYGDARALGLFREVLLASSSIPGFFPPVRFAVEANGKRFEETHADGTIRAPFYVAPETVVAGADGTRVPADPLYLILNSNPMLDYEQTEPGVAGVLGRSISATLKAAVRLEVFRLATAAKTQGFAMHLARVPKDFDVPSRGLFDSRYMKALFERGVAQGRGAQPFEADALGFALSPLVRQAAPATTPR